VRQLYAPALVMAFVLANGSAFADAAIVAAPDSKAEVVPDVAPGDEIMIACDAVEHRAADSDVRVVLTISALPDQTSPGYKKVLATDEEIGKYGVKVRIPDVPDLADHTVNLNVYVVNDSSHAGCDGGHVKVVSHGIPDFRRDTSLPIRHS